MSEEHYGSKAAYCVVTYLGRRGDGVVDSGWALRWSKFGVIRCFSQGPLLRALLIISCDSGLGL